MSHTTTIKGAQILSKSAVISTVEELSSKGIRVHLEYDATPRAYYQNQQGMGRADMVLRLGGASYDVGMYHNKSTGEYECRTDLWGGSVQKVLGQAGNPLGKFMQLYAVHAAIEAAAAVGHIVSRQDLPNGEIHLMVEA